jgi:hypothetical protein
MKLPCTGIIILAAVTLTFTECKKSAAPAAAKTNAIDYKSLASQIATSLYRSVNGSSVVKGNNLKNNSVRGKAVFDVSSLCGYTVDTTYTVDSTTAYITSYTSKNSYVLTNTCASGAVNGYTVADSIINTTNYISGEKTIARFGGHDTVTATDNTFKFYTLNGKAYSNTFESGGPAMANISQSINVISNGIKIDVSSGTPNFTAGTATFTGLQLSGTFSAAFSGKINYIGNYEAQIIFDMPNAQITNYTINIITGAIVSIP